MASFLRALAIMAAVMTCSLSANGQSLRLKTQQVTDYRELDGTVQAVNQSTVSAQVQSTVTGLYVDVGDQVAAGTLLVKLDDTEIRAQLEQARAAVAEARANLTDARSSLARIRKLYARKMAPKSNLDKAQANFGAARARLDAARAQVVVSQRQLSYTRIKAPYSGLVVARHVELGETVRPGTPLLTGLSLKQLRVSVQMPQALKAHISKGTQVKVSYHGKPLANVAVTRISPLADDQTHDFEVRANLPAGTKGVLPGESVKVSMVVGKRPALMVPVGAVMHQGELSTLYVLDDKQKPLLRQVRLGGRRGDQIEVLSGVSPGETIATDPARILSELGRKAVTHE